MANPLLVDCPANVWTKVATDVMTGQLHIKDLDPNIYLQTYRTTGSSAPPSGDKSEGVQIEGQSIQIEAIAGIDVYIMPVGVDGKIRVDVP